MRDRYFRRKDARGLCCSSGRDEVSWKQFHEEPHRRPCTAPFLFVVCGTRPTSFRQEVGHWFVWQILISLIEKAIQTSSGLIPNILDSGRLTLNEHIKYQ
jgi:hypothetical protein